MGQEYVILLAVLGISFIGHNQSVLYAAAIVLVIKLLGLTSAMDILEQKGISWGIILLTAAILVPIANGKINWESLVQCFQSPAGVVALVMGILVAVSGHFGVGFMKSSPEIVTALIIGTMAGVFFFKGIPVGPLIAAGAVYGIMEFWHLLFG